MTAMKIVTMWSFLVAAAGFVNSARALDQQVSVQVAHLIQPKDGKPFKREDQQWVPQGEVEGRVTLTFLVNGQPASAVESRILSALRKKNAILYNYGPGKSAYFVSPYPDAAGSDLVPVVSDLKDVKALKISDLPSLLTSDLSEDTAWRIWRRLAHDEVIRSTAQLARGTEDEKLSAVHVLAQMQHPNINGALSSAKSDASTRVVQAAMKALVARGAEPAQAK